MPSGFQKQASTALSHRDFDCTQPPELRSLSVAETTFVEMPLYISYTQFFVKP